MKQIYLFNKQRCQPSADILCGRLTNYTLHDTTLTISLTFWTEKLAHWLLMLWETFT